MDGQVNGTLTPSVDISSYPKLDRKQAGHLRHFYNLVSQPDGEWRHFTTKEKYQEFDDASRYQLATMTYAAGAAHYHRLPALRGPFKTLIYQMIARMLHRDVWNYWFTSSHGSKLFDPSMAKLREPWADPVAKENIMYSGHLLLMMSLYAMLFDDNRFEVDGVIFDWDPLFTGFGPERYVYNTRSLQQVILRQMEENDWVGVCCEPNAVFVVCNQFPIIAMRYNDVRNGTNIATDVLKKYKTSISAKGMVTANGLYASYFAVKQGKAMPAAHGAHTAWANAFMHAWDPDSVENLYEKQTLGFITNFDGRAELHPTRVALAFRKLVLQEGHSPHDPETLRKAREPARHIVNARIPFETLNWGCFTMMLSELGKEKTLNDLLECADAKLNPTWENGGLFYPRNDQLADDDWRLTHVEPHSGNSGIGYSRLNVKDGQKKMWEEPWTSDVLAKRPWVDGVDYSDGIDFLRGFWDEEKLIMVLTMRRWTGKAESQTVVVKNLTSGKWVVFVGGRLLKTEAVSAPQTLEIDLVIGQDDVDVIIEKLS